MVKFDVINRLSSRKLITVFNTKWIIVVYKRVGGWVGKSGGRSLGEWVYREAEMNGQPDPE